MVEFQRDVGSICPLGLRVSHNKVGLVFGSSCRSEIADCGTVCIDRDRCSQRCRRHGIHIKRRHILRPENSVFKCKIVFPIGLGCSQAIDKALGGETGSICPHLKILKICGCGFRRTANMGVE